MQSVSNFTPVTLSGGAVIMAHTYVVCKRLDVKRKLDDGSRMPLDRFSSSYFEPSVIASLLRKSGHTLVEYLSGLDAEALRSKLYFDADRDIGKSEPTPGSIDAFHLEVVTRMERYMEILRPHVHDVSYVVAQRHGYCPKKKGYKLSFRTFVNGIAIHHGDCTSFINAMDPEVGFWDMSVYKRAEQLICAINGKKGKGDKRILVPLDPSHLDDERILQYVVQHVEPGWFQINMPDDDDDDDSITVDCDGIDDSIVRLVRCLGRTTSDNRADWIRVGMILKGLGGDTYYPAWLEFSRISDKFKSDSDCDDTWRSLRAVPGAAAGRLTIGSLRYFAKRDSPAAYQTWRAHRDTHDGGNKHADLIAGLRVLGGPLGGLPETCVFNKVKNGLKFMVDESEAMLHHDSTRIFTTDEDAAYLL